MKAPVRSVKKKGKVNPAPESCLQGWQCLQGRADTGCQAPPMVNDLSAGLGLSLPTEGNIYTAHKYNQKKQTGDFSGGRG